ncbi:MAG: c-type cytochrome, partial [Anaerolineales bacterium]
HGKSLYSEICSKCHGEDGGKIVFRGEGIEETLGDVARRDPWRFLHRTRFGVAGTEMPIGYNLGWTPADGRDVLAYAQTLPAARVSAVPLPASGIATPATNIGGPATNWVRGIFTGLLAFLGTLSGSLLLFSILIILAAFTVVILRKKK